MENLILEKLQQLKVYSISNEEKETLNNLSEQQQKSCEVILDIILKDRKDMVSFIWAKEDFESLLEDTKVKLTEEELDLCISKLAKMDHAEFGINWLDLSLIITDVLSERNL